MTDLPAPNVDGVRTVSTVRSAPEASCSECLWDRVGAVGAQWLPIRAAARRHVASTGHTVLAGVRTSHLYAPEPDR
jgi:hypothetical protein